MSTSSLIYQMRDGFYAHHGVLLCEGQAVLPQIFHQPI